MAALHASLARSPAVARTYLAVMGALLRSVPELSLGGRAVNSLVNCAWPPMAFGPRSVEVCPGSKIVLTPHTGEFDFRALLCRELSYERHLFQALRQRMDRYDAIVEIGANVGAYTAFFAGARRDPGVPVYAFEPSQAAYARLVENLQHNGATNVFAIPAAVSDEPGLLPFFEPRGHLTNGSLLHDFAAHFSPDLERSIVPAIGVEQVAGLLEGCTCPLIKIDAEGAEQRILGTLLKWQGSRRAEIVVEVLEPYAAALGAIREIGEHHRLFLVTPEGLAEREAFEPHGQYRDYFLLPRDAIASSLSTDAQGRQWQKGKDRQ